MAQVWQHFHTFLFVNMQKQHWKKKLHKNGQKETNPCKQTSILCDTTWQQNYTKLKIKKQNGKFKIKKRKEINNFKKDKKYGCLCVEYN